MKLFIKNYLNVFEVFYNSLNCFTDLKIFDCMLFIDQIFDSNKSSLPHMMRALH